MARIREWAIKFLATGFFTGYSPLVPGTVGTLVGVAIYLFLANLSPLHYSLFLALLFCGGLWICREGENIFREQDSRKIVIDEIVGFLAAVFLLPCTPGFVISSFLLFRFFDWWKPFPLRRVERIGGGWGVMLDDLLAGAYANILLQIYRIVRG